MECWLLDWLVFGLSLGPGFEEKTYQIRFLHIFQVEDEDEEAEEHPRQGS